MLHITSFSKQCSVIIASALLASEPVVFGAAHNPLRFEQFNFQNPSDASAFEEDEQAVAATFYPHGYLSTQDGRVNGQVIGPKFLAQARATLQKEGATSTELFMSATMALMNHERPLALELLLRAKEESEKHGPKGNPYFFTIYSMLMGMDQDNAARRMQTALGLAKYAESGPPQELFSIMENGIRVSKLMKDSAVEAVLAQSADIVLKRIYALSDDKSPLGQNLFAGMAVTLAQHGSRVLSAGDANEAVKAFTHAKKGWDFVERIVGTKAGSVSPALMTQMRRGLSLAYGDLDETEKATEVRAEIFTYTRTKGLTSVLHELNSSLRFGDSASTVTAGGILAQQPFLLPANHPEDGTLAETMLIWKSLPTVYRRAANQRRAELQPQDAKAFAQMETEQGLNFTKTAANYVMRNKTQAKLRSLSPQAQKILGRAADDVTNTKITVAAIQAAIPNRGAIVDCLRYPHYEGHGRWQLRYGALIWTKAKAPQWVSLGSASTIDGLIARHNSELMDTNVTSKDFEKALQSLSVAVWKPLVACLPEGATEIYICPDAGLGSVSFAALLDTEGRFVGESSKVAYCVNVRDLVERRTPANNKTIALFGAPDYNRKESSAPDDTPDVNTHSMLASRLGKGFFTPLLSAKQECTEIAEKATATGFTVMPPRYDADATKLELAHVISPSILHIATHGYYYHFAATNAPSERLNDNPYNASGIALASANTTLFDWAEGKTPVHSDDGLMTVVDASHLDLHSTELTVLSCCQSGQGHQISGVGVVGLRGALYQAGTRRMIIALWRLDDNESLAFMREFYDRLFSKAEAPAVHGEPVSATLSARIETAFFETQRVKLAEARAKKQIKSGVLYAGPFVLSVTGSLVR